MSDLKAPFPYFGGKRETLYFSPHCVVNTKKEIAGLF